MIYLSPDLFACNNLHCHVENKWFFTLLLTQSRSPTPATKIRKNNLLPTLGSDFSPANSSQSRRRDIPPGPSQNLTVADEVNQDQSACRISTSVPATNHVPFHL